MNTTLSLQQLSEDVQFAQIIQTTGYKLFITANRSAYKGIAQTFNGTELPHHNVRNSV